LQSKMVDEAFIKKFCKFLSVCKIYSYHFPHDKRRIEPPSAYKRTPRTVILEGNALPDRISSQTSTNFQKNLIFCYEILSLRFTALQNDSKKGLFIYRQRELVR